MYYQPSEKQHSVKMYTLNGKVYYLNKSQSKYVNIGLHSNNFSPCLQFGGSKCKPVMFSEEDWRCLLQYQGIITNYLYSHECSFDPIKTKNFTITFDMFEESPVIKVTQNDFYVVFGSQSIFCLWQIIPLIDYRIDILKRQNFNDYFHVLASNLRNYEGSALLDKVFKVMSTNQIPDSENVSTVLELLHMYPDDIEEKIKTFSYKRRHQEVDDDESYKNEFGRAKYYEENRFI